MNKFSKFRKRMYLVRMIRNHVRNVDSSEFGILVGSVVTRLKKEGHIVTITKKGVDENGKKIGINTDNP